MIIERKWAMPNKRTFQILPIKELLVSEGVTDSWLDPFPYPYKMDAIDYLKQFEDNSAEGVVFDPPYSPRQLKECYDELGMALHDTKSSVWANWKDAIARVIRPLGKCISFGWSTNGLGITRGFRLDRILLIAHGGNHNDTIVTVEVKE